MSARALAAVLCLSVALVAIWRVLPATSYPPGYALVRQTMLAEHAAGYDAEVTTSVRSGGGWRTVSAKLYKRGPASRLEYGPEAGRAVVIINSRGTTTYEPAQHSMTVSESCGLLKCRQRARLLLKNYRASVVGEGVIAGRDTWVVSLSPKQAARRGGSSKMIWVDKKAHLILRSLDYGCNRELRSDFRIRRIRENKNMPSSLFQSSPPPSDVVCVRLEKCACLHKASDQMGFPVHKPRYVPPGFAFEGVRICRCGCKCSLKAVQIGYTDGLRTISIYDQIGHPHCKRCRNCAIEVPGGYRVLRCTGGEVLACRRCGRRAIVVVAELDPGEMRKIAESVP